MEKGDPHRTPMPGAGSKPDRFPYLSIKSLSDFDSAVGQPAAAIYFHSPACRVCSALLPRLHNMLSNHFPNLPLFVVNANKAMPLCGKLTVFTFPALLVFFEGKESLRYAGSINPAALKGAIGRPYSLLFG